MSDTLNRLQAGELTGITRLDLSAGLSEFPREIFDLADSLEILNLSQNKLSSLPDDLGRLHKLRVLFCSDNEFDHLPAVLGECPQLSMIGLRANRIAAIDPDAFPPNLRWLILTENRITDLPTSIGTCSKLQKLMLSGNQLQTLPEEMQDCTSLEMIRIASNQFRSLPHWLLEMPKLSWLAISGNPCCAEAAEPAVQKRIAWDQLSLQEKLGEGTSGTIHRALWREADEERPVAVKLFKTAVTSDGLTSCEIAASLAAGEHPNLIGTIGRIEGHPDAVEGLVLNLIGAEFRKLAEPPSLESCTRDVYARGQTFTASCALRIAAGAAAAAAHLHAQGIMHGDLYAHNILWSEGGRSVLGDLGAASFYDLGDTALAASLQAIEVRAWACLLEELIDRVRWELSEDMATLQAALRGLLERCFERSSSSRPTFAGICEELAALQRHL